MTDAERTSWKVQPLPPERELFDLPLLFSDADAERIKKGHVPLNMDDKWLIFFEDSWLYFHRSWTGHCIFAVRLDGSPNGVRVIEAWVNRNSEQYNSRGTDADRQMVEQLIRSRLLS
ncbi:MAG TPA: hypothetical protein VFT61_06055 [Sphingomicrobium sp.]|nr:hypothetical protein [Sphingomicrobium sp.]